ncbi:MAG TPA: hypothetical protein VLB05_00045 [Dongiaceae bacterium]|nr:hypothetical protein [Dongiaceae bacterium]
MFEGHRIICVTPAGRRRYLKLLVPQILACDLIDRYDLWLNTGDAGDLAFMDALARLDERVRLVPQPDGEKPGWDAIRGFFRDAQDEDAIYIRLDDDVVWLEPGFFEILLRFRIANPRYFLVMPLIINNAVCTSLLQNCGKVSPSRYVAAACMDPVGWREAEFAVLLHRFFLDLIARGETARLHCGPREIALNRFSINAICWFGRDLAAIGGKIRLAEEEDLSNTIPTRLGRANCFCTDTIAAHFAFYVQRHVVDRSDVLEQYAQLLSKRQELQPLLLKAAAIADEIDARQPPPVPPSARKRALRAIRRTLFPRRRKQPAPTLLEPGPLL